MLKYYIQQGVTVTLQCLRAGLKYIEHQAATRLRISYIRITLPSGHRLLIILICVFLVLMVGAVGRASLGFTSDRYFWLNAFVQAAILLLGTYTALHEEWAKRFKWYIMLSFLCLVSIGIYATLVPQVQADQRTMIAKANEEEAKRELTASLNDLTKATQENARLQSRIADLQNKLLESNERIVSLAARNIGEVTGGDGFVYFTTLNQPTQNMGAALIAVIHGEYAIRQVSYEITEGRPPYSITQEEIESKLSGHGPLPRSIGDIGPELPRIIGELLHPSVEAGGYYNINIYALNGAVNEKLEVRWNGERGRWERKVTVKRGSKVVLDLDWNEYKRYVRLEQ